GILPLWRWKSLVCGRIIGHDRNASCLGKHSGSLGFGIGRRWTDFARSPRYSLGALRELESDFEKGERAELRPESPVGRFVPTCNTFELAIETEQYASPNASGSVASAGT